MGDVLDVAWIVCSVIDGSRTIARNAFCASTTTTNSTRWWGAQAGYFTSCSSCRTLSSSLSKSRIAMRMRGTLCSCVNFALAKSR